VACAHRCIQANHQSATINASVREQQEDHGKGDAADQ
jgi:hypothetical protein